MAESTEEMFFQALHIKKELVRIPFDFVVKNAKDIRGRGEHDIVMQNGTYTALIEVKQKAHIQDIADLPEKQLPRFREGFGIPKTSKIILGIASPVITDRVRLEAEKKGNCYPYSKWRQYNRCQLSLI